MNLRLDVTRESLSFRCKIESASARIKKNIYRQTRCNQVFLQNVVKKIKYLPMGVPKEDAKKLGSHPVQRESVHDKLDKYFDIEKLCTTVDGQWNHPFGLFYGFRKTGKSTKIVSILYQTKDRYGTAYRFSPTANNEMPDGKYIYGRIFDTQCCWDYPTDEILDRLMIFQNY